MICPKCKTEHAHRSHRKGWKDFVLSLFKYHPYRCNQCRLRFYEFRYTLPNAADKPTSTEKEIRSTRAARNWKRRRREFLLYGGALLLFLLFLYFLTRVRDGSVGGD